MSTIAVHSGASALRFSEREPHEKGFADVFERQIAPGLASLEEERLRLRRTLFVRAILPAMALIASVAVLFWGQSPTAPQWAAYAWIAGIIVTFLLGIYAYMPATQFADQSRDLLMGPVCAFLGDLTYARARAFDVKRFLTCGIVGSHNRTNIEDVFTGQHRGTAFEMAEALLESRQGVGKNKRTVTVFRGLLIAVDLQQSAEGRVLISRELGKLGNKISGWFTGWKGLKRVELPHPEFESRFEVYADDPEEARRLLTHGFLDTMVAIARAHDKAALRAGFCEGKFLLALPMKGNLFEPGSIFRSVYGCEANIRDVLGQITIAHRVIDFIKGDRPDRLA